MATTTHDNLGHPVAAGVARLHEVLDELSDLPTWSMGQAEAAQTLIAVTRLAARVAALELRLAAHAVTVAVEEPSGATSTASWWAHATHTVQREAHGKVRLAAAMPETVAVALGRGEVLFDQARVITQSLADLPDDLDPATGDLAVKHLLGEAAHHDATALRILGRRVLEVLDPENAEAHEAAVLEREEREAAAAARFTMTGDGHGRVHGRFTLPEAHGAILEKYLTALAAPQRHHADPWHAGRPTAEKKGRAFVELIERYPTEKLPHAGGINATVVVHLDLATLLGGSKPAWLDTGEQITAAAARRMACEAAIIPAVLGGRSQVLDLGRTRRFHTTAQRITLGITQGGCAGEGCERPPGLCHVHHRTPWSHGGTTNITDALLLCPRHHTRAHDPTYQLTDRPNGKITFTRRT